MSSRRRAIHLSLYPHLDPACLGELCVFPSTAGLHLSTRFLPLAFPKLIWGSLPCPVARGPSQLAATSCWFSLHLHTYVSLALLYQWNGFPGEASSRPAIIMAPSGGWGERQAGAHLRGECFGPENRCTRSVEGWSNTSSHARVCHGGCWYSSATLLRPLTWEFSSRGGVLGTCETY